MPGFEAAGLLESDPRILTALGSAPPPPQAGTAAAFQLGRVLIVQPSYRAAVGAGRLVGGPSFGLLLPVVCLGNAPWNVAYRL